MKKTVVLVVEDETDVRELVALHLRRQGYEVDEAADGEEGLKKGQDARYGLLILDWMLPKMNGLEITKVLRENLLSQTPILMLTARVADSDIVRGLEAGADDYVTKPFEIEVLLARVKSILRRSAQNSGGSSSDLLYFGDLKINLSAHEALCKDERIPLTPSEFDLLVALARNEGRVLTRDQLIDIVRGVDISIVSRAVDTHIFGLRKKLGQCSDLIETVRGIGYRIKFR